MKIKQKILFTVLITGLLFIQNCGSNTPNNSSNPPDNNENNMILRQSSEHFNFYCIQRDTVVLDTIITLLETTYSRLENLLNYQINDTIDVYIYPDLETFHHYAVWPTGLDRPDWFVGQSVSKDVIKFASPLNPGSVHTYESVLQASVHEFCHAFNYQIVRTRARIPVWLFEGFASFAANFPTPNEELIRQIIIDNNLPSLTDLDSDQSLVEGNLYSFAYTIVEYIVNEYGYGSLSLFLSNHTQHEIAFGTGITEEVFEAGWQQFVIANYS
jgi:hypothetical protein